jgi:hydrogenase expression/formation protein HypC
MCLSVPAKILEINGDMAKASIGGSIIEVGLQLVENISVGDYVLVHTGFALERVDEEEALKTIELLNQLGEDINEA